MRGHRWDKDRDFVERIIVIWLAHVERVGRKKREGRGKRAREKGDKEEEEMSLLYYGSEVRVEMPTPMMT